MTAIIITILVAIFFLAAVGLCASTLSGNISDHEREHGVEVNGVTYWPED
jgi:hypothetical protein